MLGPSGAFPCHFPAAGGSSPQPTGRRFSAAARLCGRPPTRRAPRAPCCLCCRYGAPPGGPNPAVRSIITLGTPHLAPPAGVPDMTRGALTWLNTCFPGAFFAEQGVQYVCVVGKAIRGNALAENVRGRRTLPGYASSSYRCVCASHAGRGGMRPTLHAFPEPPPAPLSSIYAGFASDRLAMAACIDRTGRLLRMRLYLAPLSVDVPSGDVPDVPPDASPRDGPRHETDSNSSAS